MTPCAGKPDLFFSTEPHDIAAACAICAVCPCKEACARLGVDAEFGVWGGIPKGHVRGGRPLKAACPYGHAYTVENTYVVLRDNGTVRTRACKTCARKRRAA